MEQKRRPKRSRRALAADGARTGDEIQMRKLFPLKESGAAASSRKGLWIVDRDSDARPNFTHNARLVNYVRGELAAADATSGGNAGRAETTRRQMISPAVHGELGFVLEALTEQLLVRKCRAIFIAR